MLIVKQKVYPAQPSPLVCYLFSKQSAADILQLFFNKECLHDLIVSWIISVKNDLVVEIFFSFKYLRNCQVIKSFSESTCFPQSSFLLLTPYLHLIAPVGMQHSSIV